MKPVHWQLIRVTGATDDIGRISALRLAQMGASVILHGRAQTKGRHTENEIASAGGNDNLECFTAVFTSLSEVRQLAAALVENHSHLDVLINNAELSNALGSL